VGKAGIPMFGSTNLVLPNWYPTHTHHTHIALRVVLARWVRLVYVWNPWCVVVDASLDMFAGAGVETGV
jgi:hypothetical protein